jgi:hypothetical protein
MEDKNTARLTFTQEFDEELADLVEMKGWCGIGIVELPDGKRVEVTFIEPARLESDLESNVKSGRACIADPRMIVIPKITREHMEAAVQELHKSGYFEWLAAIRT